MSRTPYTDNILATFGIDTAFLRQLITIHGDSSPIGQCAEMIQQAIWQMQAAERAANSAVAALADQTDTQASILAAAERRFDASWLTHYAGKAAEANAKLTEATDLAQTFKRLMDVLLSTTTAGQSA